MFENHKAPEADKILRVMKLFADDPRADKIDLGVGVYRTPEGLTPVMGAVKAAERRLLEEQATKGYVALAGDPGFHAALRQLTFGDSAAADRIACLATPGGTGAVRQAFELLKAQNPHVTVHTSAPTWPNHEAILDTLGIRWQPYRYYDAATGGLDRDGMLADLAAVKRGDVVLLHGCCHNPTGADLDLSDWQAIADSLSRTGAVPMVDLAYQGFGNSLDEDVAGLRLLAAAMPEMLLTVSSSKNFGLYRDRVGLLLVLTETPAITQAVQGTLAWLNRQSYAFPPDHGARVVTEILSDASLRADWTAELTEMRDRVIAMREALAKALRLETQSDRFDYLLSQKGMFSRLPASEDQVAQLRREHGVYMIGDGRINMAGLIEETVRPAASAIARVLT
ncbi:aromatic amino acid transaminase [Aliiruegeria lutimaris]|uniref:Aromatic amino acid aminotransferase apoenzyme n=1 Tax=Aliiruegeria lutimaris TaxID=571298 RepID=A0A1G9CUC6_9RHOB|nr:amino acid aminotransferase [Aliiruegeria lutimaris]SDK55272.1 aromatic amino acid aminotransferase apoenzyme [Aliiruegeria lutimaris]